MNTFTFQAKNAGFLVLNVLFNFRNNIFTMTSCFDDYVMIRHDFIRFF